MSVVGLVAAAGCTGTGLLALTSDVLPFRAWPNDGDAADARQVLPPAGAVSSRRAPSPMLSSVTTTQLASLTLPAAGE